MERHRKAQSPSGYSNPDNNTVEMKVITPQGSLVHLSEVKDLLTARISKLLPLINEYIERHFSKMVVVPGHYILIPSGDTFELKPDAQPLNPLDRDKM